MAKKFSKQTLEKHRELPKELYIVVNVVKEIIAPSRKGYEVSTNMAQYLFKIYGSKYLKFDRMFRRNLIAYELENNDRVRNFLKNNYFVVTYPENETVIRLMLKHRVLEGKVDNLSSVSIVYTLFSEVNIGLLSYFINKAPILQEFIEPEAIGIVKIKILDEEIYKALVDKTGVDKWGAYRKRSSPEYNIKFMIITPQTFIENKLPELEQKYQELMKRFNEIINTRREKLEKTVKKEQ